MGLEKGVWKPRCNSPMFHWTTIVLIPWNLSLYCSTSFCEDLLISISSLHRWYLKRFGVAGCSGHYQRDASERKMRADFYVDALRFSKTSIELPCFLVGMTFPETMHTPLTCFHRKVSGIILNRWPSQEHHTTPYTPYAPSDRDKLSWDKRPPKHLLSGKTSSRSWMSAANHTKTSWTWFTWWWFAFHFENLHLTCSSWRVFQGRPVVMMWGEETLMAPWVH